MNLALANVCARGACVVCAVCCVFVCVCITTCTCVHFWSRLLAEEQVCVGLCVRMRIYIHSNACIHVHTHTCKHLRAYKCIHDMAAACGGGAGVRAGKTHCSPAGAGWCARSARSIHPGIHVCVCVCVCVCVIDCIMVLLIVRIEGIEGIANDYCTHRRDRRDS